MGTAISLLNLDLPQLQGYAIATTANSKLGF